MENQEERLLVTRNEDIEDEIDGQTLDVVIAFLQQARKKYGPKATLGLNYSAITISYESPETDAEREKRLTRVKEQQEWEYKNYLRLKKKYGGS